MDEPQAPPDTAGPLGDDARAVLGAAQAAAGAWAGAFVALQSLVRAELALAREALLRAIVLAVLAGVMLATAWGLLALLAVAGLQALGLPMPLAIALPMLVSAALAGWAAWRARATLDLAGFPATRRQLARLAPRRGEDADDGSPSPEDAAATDAPDAPAGDPRP